MKQTFFLLLALSMYFSPANAQQTDSSKYSKSVPTSGMYLKKYKSNSLIGGLMLGSGLSMVIAGAAINISADMKANPMYINFFADNNQPPKPHVQVNDGIWLSVLGGVIAVAAIPVMISARQNKHNAKLSLKNESISMKGISYTQHYPSVSFAIQLGK
jgi:hypothetical protein